MADASDHLSADDALLIGELLSFRAEQTILNLRAVLQDAAFRITTLSRERADQARALDEMRVRAEAAEARAAHVRNDALEEAARIATDQANEDRALLRDGLIDYEPAGAAILTSVNIAKSIRAAAGDRTC